MSKKWNHPELGAFEFDHSGWVRPHDFPAFNKFTYEADEESECEFPLVFEAAAETVLPSAAAVAAAQRVIANQKTLVTTIVEALWEDFNGRGPDSGMWWHGDLGSVSENLEEMDLVIPRKPADLLPLLSLSAVIVRHEDQLVELCFGAPFEEEHGIGILTDGKTVLGTGYSSDVMPF